MLILNPACSSGNAAWPCYAAFSLSTSQPGNTRTAGWHFKALAKDLALSMPRLTRPFSIAAMVD